MLLHSATRFRTSLSWAPKPAWLINAFSLPPLLLVWKEDPRNAVFSWQHNFLLLVAHAAINLWYFLTRENLTHLTEGPTHKSLSLLSLSKIVFFFQNANTEWDYNKAASSYTCSDMQTRSTPGLSMACSTFSIITALSPKAFSHHLTFSYTLMRYCCF